LSISLAFTLPAGATAKKAAATAGSLGNPPSNVVVRWESFAAIPGPNRLNADSTHGYDVTGEDLTIRRVESFLRMSLLWR
jgi:hypothetical protein